MKRSRLPLTALRSFEAAGRNASFSRAAEELHVSQAAISRQIRELETTLCAPLFERLHRKVVLTEAGKALLTQLTASFDGIERTLAEIAGRGQARTARVSSDASIAACWLIPRLDRFRRMNPDIDVVLDVDPRLIEFRADQAELALRFSDWAYCLAFAMIALAVAGDARSHREARIHPLITAVCIALFVRWLGFFAAGKANTNSFYNYLVIAVPFGASAVAGWVIFSNRRMELPSNWADWLTNMFSRFGEIGIRLRLWWANRAATRQGNS